MAEKQASPYLRHYANFSSDPRMVAMLSIYKKDGFWMYWRLKEIMREQDDGRIKITGKYWHTSTADILKVEVNQLRSFIEDCIKEFELYSLEDGYLFALDVLSDMDAYSAKILQTTAAGKASAKARRLAKLKSEPELPLSNTSVDQTVGTPVATTAAEILENWQREVNDYIIFNYIITNFNRVKSPFALDVIKKVSSWPKYWDDEKFKEQWVDFMLMRESKNLPLTVSGAKNIMVKIFLWTQEDIPLACSILQYSSDNTYTEIFHPDERKKSKKADIGKTEFSTNASEL